jgi:hypothetical protein
VLSVSIFFNFLFFFKNEKYHAFYGFSIWVVFIKKSKPNKY